MAENQLAKGLKNIKYSFLAQIVIFTFGLLKTLIVPTVLSVESYGYWQMYLFYIGYVGFFYLGFNDGILLKYGKYSYSKLPFEKLRRSMQFYMGMLAVFSCVIMLLSCKISDAQKAFTIHMVALSILIYGLNGVFIYIFLITNQIKLHSIFTAVDSVSSLLGILSMLLLHQENYRILVAFVFTAKLLTVLVMAVICRRLLFGKCASVREGFQEFLDNIRVGIFLMFAQIMSMLVTGLGRIFIEYSGEIKEYAYYSFGMTIMNIVMVGVTAVATVMYPTLGRVSHDVLISFFKRMYRFFNYFSVLVLVLYFPARFFISLLFSKYTPIFPYFPFLFAMISWQAKVSITTNSYFRVLRMERLMFRINLYSVLFFICVCLGIRAIFGHFISNPISIVAFSTYLSMAFLELLAESALRRKFHLKFGKLLFTDIAANLIFLFCAYVLGTYWGFAAYCLFVLTYMFRNRKNLRIDIGQLVSMVKKQPSK